MNGRNKGLKPLLYFRISYTYILIIMYRNLLYCKVFCKDHLDENLLAQKSNSVLESRVAVIKDNSDKKSQK